MKRIGKRLFILAAFAFLSGLCTTDAAAGDYRTIDASLNHTTPQWHQTIKNDGHPVGCGNTAWAILYGYWKQHKGKGNLLDGVSMPHSQSSNDPQLKAAMEEIANDTHSTYGTYQGQKWGRTTPGNMCDGKRYAERRGYRVTCERILGTEFDKFDRVRAWIAADKPVIILTNDPAHAFSSLHYPVIEKAQKKQKRVLGQWRDRDVSYFINNGNGGDEWIWVREVGVNDHPHTGSFSMFLVDIQ